MQRSRIAALLAVIATATFAQDKPLSLAVGTQLKLTLPGLQRVAVGDPAIADVNTVGSSEVVITGTSAGQTTVLVWQAGMSRPQHFEVTVRGSGSIAAPRPAQADDNDPATSFSPTLQVGGQVMRATPQLVKVSIADPAIAELKTGKGMVILEGLAPGHTDVFLQFSDGHREQWAVRVVR